MDGPPLRDAAVAIQGDCILQVGPTREVRRAHPDARLRDLGDCIVLPGLINPHTHLELSGCSRGDLPPGATFADWIVSIPRRLGRDRFPPEEIFPPGVRHGIAQCLHFGVTTVGDISQQMHLSRPILRDSPLRAVSYGEVLGLARMRARYQELWPLALDSSYASDRLRIGLSPHAPYTVDLPGYRECLAAAQRLGLPLATHLAETPDESEFLRNHAGPFRGIWEKLGLWEDGVETFASSPIRFANAIGLLDYPTLLAHVNYCDDAELALLAAGRASVVYCPRTHGYFGHPPHRWRAMLEAGINVAIGTDSCASSPDLNIVDDLRLAHRLAPDLPANQLWQMITIRAARALQMDARIGSLAPGKQADIAVFPVKSENPLLEILENSVVPHSLWIDGRELDRPPLAPPGAP
jgi:cytosine/adenosine deaminase-related metal-dependent hydrolase